MKQRDQHRPQQQKAQKIDIPAPVKVQIGQMLHRRPRQVEKVRVIGRQRAVDIQHDKGQRQQHAQIDRQRFDASQLCLPGQDQVDGKPHQPRVVHEALIGGDPGKIRTVCGDQDGAEAPQCSHHRKEIRQRPPRFPLFSEGQVQHDEDHQAAQVKRQAPRVQMPPAAGTLQHIAHHLADLADKTDCAHHKTRPLEAPFSAENAHSNDKRGAQPDPDKMFCRKHGLYASSLRVSRTTVSTCCSLVLTNNAPLSPS